MSATANNGVRCDGCGRISRNPLGEYRKPDGSAGYILGTPFWDETSTDDDQDYCEECGRELQPTEPKVSP
jgi:hypothetical protein